MAAPPQVVFRWLCQLRAAPYSYDWIDNFGRRSPRALTPGLERLALGQRFMTVFELVAFEPDRHVTLLARRFTRLLGAVAVTYLLTPLDGDRSRLVCKALVAHPGGAAERRLRAGALPWLDLVMARKQLRTLRDLAEGPDPANHAMLDPA